MLRRICAVSCFISLSACGGTDNIEAGGTAGASSSTDPTLVDAGTEPVPCDPNQNALTLGHAPSDLYDCLIIELSRTLGHPDPRVVKSQMMQESSYQVFAVSPDIPCGTHEGWTDEESKSFGLLQVTLACGEGETARLPDGRPNLERDEGSELWKTSIFNPEVNLREGISRIVQSMNRLKERHPGCAETEYTLMAAGAYNSGTRAVQGCLQFNDRARNYVNNVLAHYVSFSIVASWPFPYPEPPL